MSVLPLSPVMAAKPGQAIPGAVVADGAVVDVGTGDGEPGAGAEVQKPPPNDTAYIMDV